MTSRSKRAAWALLLFAALCAPAAADRTIDRSYPIRNVALIVLQADTADLHLVADAAISQFRVSAALRGNIAAPRIEFTRSGTHLLVTIRSPHVPVLPFARHGSVAYEITYPARTPLEIHDFLGDVQVDAPLASLTAESESGDVTVNGARGPLDLLADEGAVNASVAPNWHGAEIRMVSGGGDVSLTVPPNIRAHVDASSDGGAVRDTVPQHAKGPLFFLYTQSGDVTVSAP